MRGNRVSGRTLKVINLHQHMTANHQAVAGILVDIKEAFDCIDWECIESSLQKTGTHWLIL